MKIFNSFLFFFFLVPFSFSQAPEIQWQNTIGGSAQDYIYSTSQTSDGGYILGGWSYSDISGDKTENKIGGYDYWVVKTNASGDIIWQNTIGGTGDDKLYSVEQTIDGGYILGGFSNSGMSDDKSEGSIGFTDYWVVKINSSGIIEWDNTIGGTGTDELYDVHQTFDGGYILGGYSYSELSGDKTEDKIEFSADFWVIKLDGSGNIMWQNTIGGNQVDFLAAVDQTSDGGYILGGYSSSSASGDKTEGHYNDRDYWIVKLNAIGEITWQNTIGGNQLDELTSIEQTAEGGYIVGGFSFSGISYDKTEPNQGNEDYWIIKLNGSGNIQWQNTIGGNSSDYLYSLKQTSDGGFIVGGASQSGLSGDKTEPLTTIGYYDFWILKLDVLGNIIWQNSVGGNFNDFLRSIEQTTDNGYILGGQSDSGIFGDKTEACIGTTDYWLIKLIGDTCIAISETCNSFDDNCNGITDEGIIESISIFADSATTFCQGGSVVLSATYTGETVQWQKDGVNISGATSSTYTATTKGTYTSATTSACATATSEGIFVNVQKNPLAFISAGGPTIFCPGGTVVLTANAGAGLNYQWFKGPLLIPGATNINYTVTTSGNYKCRVTKIGSGCNKLSNVIAVAVICKEENELIDNNKFIIYPNPSSENIIITLSSTILTTLHSPLTITDISGKTIAQYQLISPETEIDISNYPSGIYFVKMIFDNKQLTEKFIKQ